MGYFFIALAVVILIAMYFIVNQSTYRVTEKELNTLPEPYKVIDDLELDIDDENTLHIDHIVVGKPGIYLINIIDRKGIITGDESQPKWKETIGDKIEEFDNPTFSNIKKMHLIREKLGDSEGSIPISSIVVFHKKADLNDLFSESLTIRANALKNYINSELDNLSVEKINEVVKDLTM
ncbi:MAG: nuclease-related domain-containing protein [Clostridia bacterium]